MATRAEIVRGPSRYALQNALFDIEHREPVTFTVMWADGRKLEFELMIDKVGVEVGFDEWEIHGFIEGTGTFFGGTYSIVARDGTIFFKGEQLESLGRLVK